MGDFGRQVISARALLLFFLFMLASEPALAHRQKMELGCAYRLRSRVLVGAPSAKAALAETTRLHPYLDFLPGTDLNYGFAQFIAVDAETNRHLGFVTYGVPGAALEIKEIHVEESQRGRYLSLALLARTLAASGGIEEVRLYPADDNLAAMLKGVRGGLTPAAAFGDSPAGRALRRLGFRAVRVEGEVVDEQSDFDVSVTRARPVGWLRRLLR